MSKNVTAVGTAPAPSGYVQEFVHRIPECVRQILGKSCTDERFELLINAAVIDRYVFVRSITATHPRAMPKDVFYMKMCGFVKEQAVKNRVELTGQLELSL